MEEGIKLVIVTSFNSVFIYILLILYNTLFYVSKGRPERHFVNVFWHLVEGA